METPQQLARPTSDEDWQPYYATIRKLWWDEDRTLTDVANVMRADHGFHATTKQYKRMLDKWELGKNIKNHEMKGIAKIQAQRRPKNTEFIVRAKPVPQAKIDRFLKRTMGTVAPSPSAFSPMVFTPLEVFYYTPNPPASPVPMHIDQFFETKESPRSEKWAEETLPDIAHFEDTSRLVQRIFDHCSKTIDHTSSINSVLRSRSQWNISEKDAEVADIFQELTYPAVW